MDGLRQRRDPPANIGHEPILEIDTIFGSPYVGEETRNTQRNYVRKAKDPL